MCNDLCSSANDEVHDQVPTTWLAQFVGASWCCLLAGSVLGLIGGCVYGYMHDFVFWQAGDRWRIGVGLLMGLASGLVGTLTRVVLRPVTDRPDGKVGRRLHDAVARSQHDHKRHWLALQRMVWVCGGALALAALVYALYPKYYFPAEAGGFVRCNRITGAIEQYDTETHRWHEL